MAEANVSVHHLSCEAEELNQFATGVPRVQWRDDPRMTDWRRVRITRVRYNSGSEKPGDADTSPVTPNPHSLLGGTRMSDHKDTIPYGFCHCGCGQKTNIATKNQTNRGSIKGQPCRFLPYHHHFKRTSPVLYIEEDRGYETPCWIWQRATTHGYGVHRRSGRSITAHIVFYEEKFGPVPKGLELDHLCRVRACCNPDHLEAVTTATNTRRGNQTKLTWDQVNQIRAIGRSMKQIDIAAMFGIGTSQVSRILLGQRWVAE